jgi:hypothetical protein
MKGMHAIKEPLESLDGNMVLAQGVSHLPRRQAQNARSLGLHPTAPFHGIYQALTLIGAVVLSG